MNPSVDVQCVERCKIAQLPAEPCLSGETASRRAVATCKYGAISRLRYLIDGTNSGRSMGVATLCPQTVIQ